MKKLLSVMKAFLASELFDVCLFWFGVALVGAGIVGAFGIPPALVVVGLVLVLSVKPIARWIK